MLFNEMMYRLSCLVSLPLSHTHTRHRSLVCFGQDQDQETWAKTPRLGAPSQAGPKDLGGIFSSVSCTPVLEGYHTGYGSVSLILE